MATAHNYQGVFSILLLWTGCLLVSAQENLIPNPSFEKYRYCDSVDLNDYKELNTLITDWHGRKYTPRYKNTLCSEQYIEGGDIFCGYFCDSSALAQKGSGFIMMSFDPNFLGISSFDRRAYAQTQLKEALIPGRRYYITWYQSLMNSVESIVPYSHTGILFSDSLVIEEVILDGMFEPILADPQVEIDTIPNVKHLEWSKFDQCFSVDSMTTVMTVGNFAAADEILHDPENKPAFITYGFDNFYLAEISDSVALEVSRDTICVGDCVSLSTNHSLIPGEFLWQLPGSDLGSSTDSAIVVCYSAPGVYDISIEIEHCTGLYEQPFPEAIVVLPAIEHESMDTVRLCAGESYSIAYDVQYGFRWLDDYPSVARVFTSSGTYAYELQSGLCVDTFELPVQFRLEPTTQDTLLLTCSGDTIFYGGEYYSETGIYYDTLGSSELCDSVYETISLQYYTRSSLDVEGEAFLCGEGMTMIEIISAVTQVEWQDGVLGHAREIDEPGTYAYSYVDEHGCQYQDSLQIVQYEPPQVSISDLLDINFMEPIEVPVQYIGVIETYLWSGDPLEVLDCIDCAFPKMMQPREGHYTIQVENMYGCRDTAHMVITLASSEVYIGNVVSVHGLHPAQQSLFPQSDFEFAYELEVYNRWGSLVYHTRNARGNNPNDGWIPGPDIQSGVYTYILRYQYNGRNIQRAGDVTVLR